MIQIARLARTEDLDRLMDESHVRPVFLFKHSLACRASRTVLTEFEALARARSSDAGFGLVEIQNARAVSAEIAVRTGVQHESPQAILLRDGRAVWHASHWDVTEESLAAALAAAPTKDRSQ